MVVFNCDMLKASFLNIINPLSQYRVQYPYTDVVASVEDQVPVALRCLVNLDLILLKVSHEMGNIKQPVSQSRTSKLLLC